MSVKFIRTCDRCGKVIEERNGYVVEGKAPVKSNAEYSVVSVECHPNFKLTNFHLCPDCCEDFESFMSGQLVCDISDREADVHVYDGEPFRRASEEECQAFAEEMHNKYKQVTDKDIAQMLPAEDVKKKTEEYLSKKLEQDGYIRKNDLADTSNWSPEVLEMARKHNESCEKPKTEVSTSVDKSKIQLKPGTHTYHRWTKEEDRFIAFHSAGMTTNELANKFGVTLKAVAQRKSMILNGKVRVDRED